MGRARRRRGCGKVGIPPYTIGGTVSGLLGTGLVLQDNGGNNLSVSANGSFTFTTAIATEISGPAVIDGRARRLSEASCLAAAPAKAGQRMR